jgi:hypothetical protein
MWDQTDFAGVLFRLHGRICTDDTDDTDDTDFGEFNAMEAGPNAKGDCPLSYFGGSE